MSNALQALTNDIYGLRQPFEAALVDKSISLDREAEFAMQQLRKNDYTMKVALGNPASVCDAVMSLAAIGISLNPAKKQAYLVPRGNAVCLDISYMGLIDLAVGTGSVKWAQAIIVHEADSFTLNGLDKMPTHGFNPFSKDRGPVVGVYCTVKTLDGDYLTHTMTIADALAIRDRSDAYSRSKSGPWRTDEGEMVKKTVVKQAYKYWPKTDRLSQAIEYTNTVAGEGLVIENGDTGTPPAAKPLPPYAADKFKTNLPAWRKAIAEGKATADSIIAKLKTVGVLTPEQESEIKAPAPVDHAQRLRDAKTIDELNERMGAILEQTPELNAVYDQRLAELGGA